jgi:hypothetical protein
VAPPADAGVGWGGPGGAAWTWMVMRWGPSDADPATGVAGGAHGMLRLLGGPWKTYGSTGLPKSPDESDVVRASIASRSEPWLGQMSKLSALRPRGRAWQSPQEEPGWAGPYTWLHTHSRLEWIAR